ncbi:hypothetical protein [Methylovirgula sp. 4M-Z18]|uniref:hypothetical protein n=1 Tax=Methylovirgula sp. 4M-Z18 TaxID=2293567 RepID=UPI000E385335|nr:hypothetical protein [Methylovirgula sp. 4M-Z18]RFB79048.1 hypothetical protein DYH55_14630 [Methylovirgula sp. 4M-Z18]
MPDMFSPKDVRREPTDIEMVQEVTLQQLSDWLLRLFGALPEHLLQHFRDLEALKNGLSPIFNEMRDGDSLWLCQSRFRAPLWGHEGVALVRDNRPIVYILMMNH